MAKKKGGKKTDKGKPPARYRKPEAAPRDRDLPGMANRRIRPLDQVAASIADCRAAQNAAIAEEKALKTTALRLMRQHNKTIWKHAGVELIRVPGEEKLNVRQTKGTGDVDVETGTQTEQGEVIPGEFDQVRQAAVEELGTGTDDGDGTYEGGGSSDERTD